MTIYTCDGMAIGAKSIELSLTLENLIIDESIVIPSKSVVRISESRAIPEKEKAALLESLNDLLEMSHFSRGKRQREFNKMRYDIYKGVLDTLGFNLKFRSANLLPKNSAPIIDDIIQKEADHD